MSHILRTTTTAAVLAATIALLSCASPTAAPPTSAAQTTAPDARPGASGEPPRPARPAHDPTVIVRNLAAPWSMVRHRGSVLISERDSGRIRELRDGELRTVQHVQGAVHDGEGGLLGLAVREGASTTWLYAYYTTDHDNRVSRWKLHGSPGHLRMNGRETIVAGLAKAANHDGGRIKFGPDGRLYITVGDAAVPERAQDESSRNGKILRVTARGDVPEGNPFGTAVWSLGHRNPQGIAWDHHGRMFAAEFGQNTWDEFNRIGPGSNYGWPLVEGIGDEPGYRDPLVQWPTSQASPSGLTFIDGTFFLAALRGERLWAITVEDGSTRTEDYFAGRFGRIRDVAEGPHGTLWVLTNNTDGRGDPGANDDRILQFDLDKG